MSHAVVTNQVFVKQQRGSVVVLNAFTAYVPATDVLHFRRKQFFVIPGTVSYRYASFGLTTSAIVPPVPQTGDIFCGYDTYGWPEPPPPWWSRSPGFVNRFTTTFVYNPNTDPARFGKRSDMFADFLEGMAYQTFAREQINPQLWQTAALTLVPVPDVTTETLGQATADLTLAGLTASVVGSAYDPVIALGSVVSQSPVGGQNAVIGTAVMLVLSLGPPPLPPFVGITLPDAIFIAVNADLIVEQPIVWQYDPIVPYNYVISQDPPAGTVVTPMSVVRFVASLGPAPVVTANVVPNVVGLMVLDAQNAISTAGCNAAGISFVYSDTVQSGYVISQSIPAGTNVPYGTQVSIVVSVGTPATLPTGQSIIIPVMH